MEYNRMISDRIRENQLDAIRHYPQPVMFGGIRIMAHPQASGNEFMNPPTLATGGNLTKSFAKLGKDVGKIGKKSLNAITQNIPNMASKVVNDSIVPALSKYGEKALTNYLAPAAEDMAITAVGAGQKRGRGRPRKGGVGGGIGLKPNFIKGVGGSFKSVMKQVGKVGKQVGKQVLNKALPMAEKYAANAVMDYALPAAETGAEFVAANPEVLLLAAGRKGRFVKGSQAAKDYMKSIRDKKKK